MRRGEGEEGIKVMIIDDGEGSVGVANPEKRMMG